MFGEIQIVMSVCARAGCHHRCAGFNCMCGLQTFLGQMRKMRMYCAALVIIKGVPDIFRSLCCSLLINPSLMTVVSMS